MKTPNISYPNYHVLFSLCQQHEVTLKLKPDFSLRGSLESLSTYNKRNETKNNEDPEQVVMIW